MDYGEGYIGAGHLCWSPGEVMLLLTDWLPRKTILDADQRTALPDVLRQWLRFALTQRGIDPDWIGPVVEAVDAYLAIFRDAFDDDNRLGPRQTSRRHPHRARRRPHRPTRRRQRHPPTQRRTTRTSATPINRHTRTQLIHRY